MMGLSGLSRCWDETLKSTKGRAPPQRVRGTLTCLEASQERLAGRELRVKNCAGSPHRNAAVSLGGFATLRERGGQEGRERTFSPVQAASEESSVF